MNNNNFSTLTLLMAFSLAASPAVASNDYFDLPLENLSQLRVSVASKNIERISHAPSSITSYTQRDIQQLGYYNVAELASITPGYSTYTNIGENTLETRGQKASGFDNNRHLLLIDGIPVNHLRSNALQADNHLPLFFAEQVDYLRGPASALYGVSAFYGVVSITPQEQSQSGHHVAARVSAGDYDNDRRVMANYLTKTDGGTGGLRVGYYEKDASETIIGGSPDHLLYDDQQSLFLYGSWQWDTGMLSGLRVGTLYMQKEGGLGNFWSNYSSELAEINWETLVAYAKYQRSLSQDLAFHGYLKYAYAVEASTFYDQSETLKSEYDYPFQGYEGQAELHWTISPSSNLIGGVNYDTRYGEKDQVLVQNVPRETPRTPDVDTASLYLQYQKNFDVLSGLQLTAGLREDHGSAGGDSYSHLSPRVALVQRLSDTVSLKLMYGEALRGPSVKEVGVNDEVRMENPGAVIAELEPETIRTFELAPYFQTERWLASVTLFRTTTEDFIIRDNSSFSQYSNLDGSTDTEGLEFELNFKPTESSKLFFNYAYANSEDYMDRDIDNVPEKKANLGLQWSRLVGVPLSGSVVARWIDGYTNADPEGSSFDGHTLVDFNLDYALTKRVGVGLQIKNVFGQSVKQPVAGLSDLPLPGRTVALSFNLQAFD